jgi:hypothetical protein
MPGPGDFISEQACWSLLKRAASETDEHFMHQSFIETIKSNPINAALLDGLASLGLPQCYLTAGCLFQAVWNRVSGMAASASVRDYDIIYFDDSDLSWEAEDQVIKRVQSHFSGLGVQLEVKNQARVHLWYEQTFGSPYPKLTCATGGIDRFLISCTQIGIEAENGRLYAPDGFQDLHEGILRMNPMNRAPTLFMEKALSFQARWSWLTIVQPE